MEPTAHPGTGCPVDVHVLLHRGPRLLLLRRSRTSPYAPGLLCLPSGKVEPGEDVVTAAVREVAEETGVVLHPTMLRCDLVLQHRPPQGPLRIGWFFTAEGWPGARDPATPDTVRNAEPHKHDELVWVDPDDPPHDLVAYTRAALDAIRAGTPYALHLQQPHDTVHDDGNAWQRLAAIRAGDHGNEPLRRELGLRAAPRMGRRWVWQPDEPVPGSLRVAQSSGWLFADDGRVLLVADQGMLALPGGGTEDEDGDALATLTREAYEEAGAVLGASTYLGYLHDHDALVHGGTPVARARYAARLTRLGPARPDPATGREWRRFLVDPATAADLLGWGPDGLREARSAQRGAHEVLGVPIAGDRSVVEVPRDRAAPWPQRTNG
ncbi:NUDIX hydrolase (plasmid) [Embleya sp. NBC_00888]|uniref:NUDIX hydrolase n=1 Tax=Embleya sp. NBC_00888 TaxID=2975960 RepID=UPI002F909352|nr:NUDIX hydrolase [Embleya sp. NBC_00888]